MKSIFGGSALACTALAGLLIVLARPLSAETLFYGSQTQDPKQAPISSAPEIQTEKPVGDIVAKSLPETPVAEPTNYVATAYSLRGRTASGRPVSKGLIAADPRVLPLGSRVRLEAGAYSGEYLVADTGALVKGKRIDIWTPTTREAMKFGRRTVKLTILSYGGKRKAAHTKTTPRQSR